MDEFDPYEQWLGIPPTEQPAHYYRLLGLPIFTTDAERIQAEADRRMQHVRTFQLGKRSPASQAILNELAAARVCLLSPDSKARYDIALSEWLAARLPVPPPVLPPESPPLLAADEDERTAGLPVAGYATAPRRVPTTRKKSYTGWLIVGGVVAVTCAALVVLRYQQRPQQGALERAADVRPTPSDLPESPRTGDANLGGKTVSVPSEVILQSEQGDVHLQLARAKISGPTLKLDGDVTADWRSPDDDITWQFLIRQPGIFRIVVTYAADAASDGGEAQIALSGRPRPLTMSIRNTGGRDVFASDELSPMVKIDKSGRYTLSIAPIPKPGEQLMTLRGVLLRRAPVR